MDASEGKTVRGGELFGYYRRLIEALARTATAEADSLTKLRAIMSQFEADATTLTSSSARILREGLCEQLEHEALISTRLHTREVLFAAVKLLELGA